MAEFNFIVFSVNAGLEVGECEKAPDLTLYALLLFFSLEALKSRIDYSLAFLNILLGDAVGESWH